MRIAFVTQWFPPEPGMLVSEATASGLSKRGHEVHVLTGFPNYPSGVLHPGYPLRPYRRDEHPTGLTVHRAPLFPSHDRSAPRRAVNYVTFAGAATMVGRRRMPTPDAWLIYSSPATAALPALLSGQNHRAPMFLMIQDLWPDSVLGSGLIKGRAAELADRGLTAFCNWTYARAAGIGVISPSMRNLLVARGVSSTKIHDTPNWVDDIDPAIASDTMVTRATLGLPAGRLFMYAGNMGALQGLQPLLAAFAAVPSAQLVLVGDGVARSELEAQVRRERLRNVTFVAPQPADRIGAYIAASDVQVVSLLDTPLLRATMPSKVQGALAAGKPVLAHAAGDVAQLVDSHRVGRGAPPSDPVARLEAIQDLAEAPHSRLATMGRAGRRLYETMFSPAVGLDRIEAMLHATHEERRSA